MFTYLILCLLSGQKAKYIRCLITKPYPKVIVCFVVSSSFLVAGVSVNKDNFLCNISSSISQNKSLLRDTVSIAYTIDEMSR